MKKLVSLLALFMGLILLSGCAPKDNIIIKTYKDQKVNLAGYKTFQFLVGANILVDDNQKWKARAYDLNRLVEFEIASQLMDKDIHRTQTRPDFIISYVVGVNMDAIQEKIDNDGATYFKNVPVAGLGIVFLDPQTKRVIWASNAEGTVDLKRTDKESKERISYAIEQMFTKF